ncbi:MAG: RluA family pseudouridine synthase [Lachnospiraceae bacterium]|nr:RluA family pseudouridine synthase [Lachnospiraceae bacterium]
MQGEILEFQVTPTQAGERLDKFLSAACPGYSRSFIQKLAKEGRVLVNQKEQKVNYKVSGNDHVQAIIPPVKELEVHPEQIPLDILYEDDSLLIVNKPKGMVVHPSAGHESGTLVNAVLYHCKESLSGINGIMRPGIVHRIDQDTTGALVVCKNDNAHLKIAEQMKAHSVTRRYFGIVKGVVKQDIGTVEGDIGRHPIDRKKMAVNVANGKHAVTHYKVLQRFSEHTYVEFELETGRTHQIRVHMASIGHPLLGDEVYGNGKSLWKLQGQTLHAATIGFIHPATGNYLEVTAPLPEYFASLLSQLSHNRT